MSGFELEERYIVVKRKHLDEAAEAALRGVIAGLDLQTVECIVIEEDWPLYPRVLGMLEQQVEVDTLEEMAPRSSIYVVSNSGGDHLYATKSGTRADEANMAGLEVERITYYGINEGTAGTALYNEDKLVAVLHEALPPLEYAIAMRATSSGFIKIK